MVLDDLRRELPSIGIKSILKKILAVSPVLATIGIAFGLWLGIDLGFVEPGIAQTIFIVDAVLFLPSLFLSMYLLQSVTSH